MLISLGTVVAAADDSVQAVSWMTGDSRGTTSDRVLTSHCVNARISLETTLRNEIHELCRALTEAVLHLRSVTGHGKISYNHLPFFISFIVLANSLLELLFGNFFHINVASIDSCFNNFEVIAKFGRHFAHRTVQVQWAVRNEHRVLNKVG